MRKIHRYLGIFIGIQIFFWVVSGLYFTWNDLDKVRGQHLASEASSDLGPMIADLADFSRILATFLESRSAPRSVERVELRSMLGSPVFEITYRDDSGTRYQLADAKTGELLPPLDMETAKQLAREDFSEDADIKHIQLLDTATPHSEYRGRDLPVYRITMDHPSNTNIYVSAQRGLITARRNTTWRIFDFLWMLHTMDFRSRDDFNNLLVKIFSILGLLVVLSGFILWGTTSRVFRRSMK